MGRIRIPTMACLCCLVALPFPHCSRNRAENSAGVPAPTGTLKPADDFKATLDAYGKATDAEVKARLWFDFLARNPNNNYTPGTIFGLVNRYFLDLKKDPEGAVRFAVKNVAQITDEKLKRRADSGLMRLYGRLGKKDEMRQLVGRMQTRGPLDLVERITAAEASLEARDWDFARNHCEALLEENTPERVRSEPGQEKSSGEQLQRSLDRNRGRALFMLGRAALELNDCKTSLGHFGEAGKLATYDYVGLPSWPFSDLNLHWAKALLRSGNPEAALDRISRDAMILERKSALEVLADAHRAAGLKGSLREYIDHTKPSITRDMAPFSAYDYDRKKVSYDSLKGKVTLLAFWFPT